MTEPGSHSSDLSFGRYRRVTERVCIFDSGEAFESNAKRAKGPTRALDLSALKYVAASADAGNFSRAGKILGLYPSTVSRRVSRFEDQLGLTLFERGRFGLRLTAGGRAVMVHIRRALADLEAVERAGESNAIGEIGEIKLGVRMPPVGEPLRTLLSGWRAAHPMVGLTLFEMNEREMSAALEERRLDVALVPKHTLWPRAVAVPVSRERLVAAIPAYHKLAAQRSVTWIDLVSETLLVQGWDDSHSAREFFASFLGSGVDFRTHAASKQSVLALIAAGYGVTLATESQAEAKFPGVEYREIAETNAWVDVELAWIANSEEAVVGRFIAFMRDQAATGFGRTR